MGVPKFAAWLTKKYPAMVLDQCPDDVHGLYIDLNGLIHPCCHDEEDPSVAARPEEEKLRQICLAVETLMVTARPQSVVYIAIDGVAPRAKMNQQRARRYMSAAVPLPEAGEDVVERDFTAEERADAAEALQAAGEELMQDALYGQQGDTDDVLGSVLPAVIPAAEAQAAPRWAKPATEPKNKSGTAFDSNCLSPGTSFMEKVSLAMRRYIERKLSSTASSEGETVEEDANAAIWKSVTVIFSDSNVPGEGEHKLIDFLRTQSSFPGFNGHGSHVVAGLDADLIFLTLSLHIPRVYILRDNKRPSSFEKKEGDADKGKKGSSSSKHAGKKKKSNKKQGAKKRGGDGNDNDEEEDNNDDDTASSSSTDCDSEAGDEDDETHQRSLLPNSKNDNSNNNKKKNGAAGEEAAAVHVEACTTYEYYDVDVVGSSLVSEIYQLTIKKKFAFLATDTIQSAKDVVAGNGYCFGRVGGQPGAPLREEEDEKEGGGQRHPTNRPPFHPCTAACNSKIIDDFIVLGFVMGNDFLPRIPCVFCGEAAMDLLFELYIEYVLPYGYLTLGNHEIDLRQLARLFAGLSTYETMAFRQFSIRNGVMAPAEGMLPFGHPEDDRAWRLPYYRSCSINPDRRKPAADRAAVVGEPSGAKSLAALQPHVDEACRTYVEGMRFVWRYYSCTSQQVSWSWQYPFFHGPLARDMAAFLERQGENVQTALAPPKLEATPPDTVTQLLCILPPTSSAIVPACLRHVMHDPASATTSGDRAALVDTFPKTWLVDYSASFKKDHLATVMTPLADLDQLKALVQEKESAMTDDERRRMQNHSFHLVFRRKGERQGFVFHIQGDGLATLPREKHEELQAMSGWAPAAEDTIEYYTLEEVAPLLNRARTYSFTVVVPNLTVLPDGRVARQERRPFKGFRKKRAAAAPNESAPQQLNKFNKKAKEASPVQIIRERMNFAEFIVLCAVISLCTVSLVTRSFLFGHLLLKLQITSIYLCVLGLAYVLGVATNKDNLAYSEMKKEMARNSVRNIFVDWQCAHCLSLNFSRNVKCYCCSAPYDVSRCTAVFSGKLPPEPPLMDPHHERYMERFGLAE